MALKTVTFVAFKLFLYGVCRKGSCEMGNTLDMESECLGLVLVLPGNSFIISESYLTYFIFVK